MSNAQPQPARGPTAAQRAAIDARGNVLVSAGAGTGKTATLVERCIALVQEGGSSERMLLVTFTEAAALEMRHRLRDAFERKAREALEAHLPEIHELWERQVAILDSASIGTLHGLCLKTIREGFHRLELDPQLNVTDELQAAHLLEQSLVRLFEAVYAGNDARADAARALIRVNARGRESVVREWVLGLYTHARSLPQPLHWLAAQRESFLSPEPFHWQACLIETFLEWRTRTAELCELLPGLPQLEPVRALAVAAGPCPEYAAVSRTLIEVRNTLGEIPSAPRKTVPAAREALKEWGTDLEFLWDQASGSPSGLEKDWALARGPMVALIGLVEELDRIYSGLKQDLGAADFSDLEQHALRLLWDPSTGDATAFGRLWRERFDHVFVDEYQDINDAQDAILRALSRHGEKANRFLVGDVKQSIYRFRRANPAIFRGYEQAWSGDAARGTRCVLADNFRSHPAILDFVNRFCGPLMGTGLGGVFYEELRSGHTPVQPPPEPPAGGLVPGIDPAPRVELLTLTSPRESEGGADPGEDGEPLLAGAEAEARLIASRIAQLKQEGTEILDKATGRMRPMAWDDVVVLMRAPAGKAEVFAREFARWSIPLNAPRTGFFSSPEVADLLALARILDNPVQDIPLLTVLRSPLVGFSPDELVAVRLTDRRLPLWTTLRRLGHAAFSASPAQASLPPALLAAARHRTLGFLKAFDRWRDWTRRSSLSHCLELVLSECGYDAMTAVLADGAQRWGNVRRFVDWTRQFDPYGGQALHRFLRFVDPLEENGIEPEPARGSALGQVRLMSIHQSKGLEFPVVVVAALGSPFNLRDLSEDLLISTEGDIAPRIAPPPPLRRYPSIAHVTAARQAAQELRAEELRLLYVAMTRARDRLILVGRRKQPKPASEGANPPSITLESVGGARAPMDWVNLWLHHSGIHAEPASNGPLLGGLLRWSSCGTDALPAPGPLPGANETAVSRAEPAPIRLTTAAEWDYPHLAATRESGKTSVSQLRARARDSSGGTGDEAHSLLPRSPARGVTAAPRALHGVDVGTAHHTLMEHLDLGGSMDLPGLHQQRDRLVQARLLSPEQAGVLDLDAVAAFWASPLGGELMAVRPAIRRELPFTAAMRPADIERLGLPSTRGLDPDELQIIQGVVDLAVVQADQIWIIDYKTDQVDAASLASKVETYTPQLQLYGAALSRILRRPVTRLALFLFRLRRAVELPLR